LRNLLATLGLVVALAAAAGCGSNENSGTKVSSGSSPGTRATQAPAAPTSFKVGDQIKVGNTILFAVIPYLVDRLNNGLTIPELCQDALD